jgi:DNA-binding transcriptional MerR regulator
MRLDELARRAGVATTTIRLYQSRGLLAGPRLIGRVGFYDDSHLTRLRLIGRLQDEGFSLAGIGRLLASWDGGRDLADLVGVDRAVVVDPLTLLERFPAGALTPDLLQRAIAAGLVQPTDDGRLRVPDRRFLDTGSALAGLGLPAGVILDEWEHLVSLTDVIAERWVSLFEQHLVPVDRSRDDAGLAGTLTQLRQLAGQVVAAALDDSMARAAARRLGR